MEVALNGEDLDLGVLGEVVGCVLVGAADELAVGSLLVCAFLEAAALNGSSLCGLAFANRSGPSGASLSSMTKSFCTHLAETRSRTRSRTREARVI